jgi:hypothetical protein
VSLLAIAVSSGSLKATTAIMTYIPEVDPNRGFSSDHRKRRKRVICKISPLQLACATGQVDLVDYLLESGVDVDISGMVTHKGKNQTVYVDYGAPAISA